VGTRLEKAIEFLSPGWARQRAIDRAQLDNWREVQASHRGGLSTRVSTPWSQSISYRNGTTAQRQNLASRRDRSRRVYQEHPIGRGILQTETDNIVADGFVLQSKTGTPDFDKEAEEKWEDWWTRCDIRGLRCSSELQRQMYRSPRRDGDGGVVLVDRGGDSRLQYIPGDLIKTPDGKYGNPSIIDGVEVDRTSRPVAFHILDIDGTTSVRQWDRVPAQNFIYLAPVIDDDMGVRGDPCYSQVFSQLDGLDGYMDAVIIAARMAAVFGLIFKDDKAAKQYNQLGTLTNSQGDTVKGITLENGQVRYTGTDGKVEQVNPQQPMQQTPDFIRICCRILGIPFDMPLELVLKDLSQVNFASARIGLLQYYRACRARQKWFRETCLDRIYRWWISREQKRQLVGNDGAFLTAFPANYFKHNFVAVGWDYTDPVSEAQADQLQIDMGVKTPQMVAAERGRDWDEMQEELAVARAVRRLKELPNVMSNMTRDEFTADTTQQNNGVDPELERLKGEADAYGVGVRAGVITPQTDDEDAFRKKMKLPAMSEDAKAAWEEDEGVRRPITLTQPGGASPMAGPQGPGEEQSSPKTPVESKANQPQRSRKNSRTRKPPTPPAAES
jgi:lambda family phage portal protein